MNMFLISSMYSLVCNDAVVYLPSNHLTLRLQAMLCSPYRKVVEFSHAPQSRHNREALSLSMYYNKNTQLKLQIAQLLHIVGWDDFGALNLPLFLLKHSCQDS